LMPTTFSLPWISTIRSTSRKGKRCGTDLKISLTSSIALGLLLTARDKPAHLFFQATYGAPQLRQLRQQRHDFQPFVMRRRTDAPGKDRAGRHRLGNAGLRTDDRVVADHDVIDHAHL